MIVDDSITIRRSFSNLLKKEGYDLLEVANGIDGIIQANKIIPDMIFMDVMMPKIDGYEVCRAIKNESWGSSIYICMLTGKDHLLDRVKAYECKADNIITKPYNEKTVFSLLESVKAGDCGKFELFGITP